MSIPNLSAKYYSRGDVALMINQLFDTLVLDGVIEKTSGYLTFIENHPVWYQLFLDNNGTEHRITIMLDKDRRKKGEAQ